MTYRTNKHPVLIVFGTVGFLVILFLIGGFYLPEKYQIGTEVVVSRKPESIWKWFIRPSNWNKRFTMITSVEALLSKGSGVGEQLTIETNVPGGMKLKSNIVITDWVKDRLIADLHREDWLNGKLLPVENVIDRIAFQPEGLRKTRIIFKESFEVRGPFNKWLAYLVVKPAGDRLMAEVLSEYNRSIQEKHTSPVAGG